MAAAEERASTLDQHNREIHENAAAWRRKALLRTVYGEFYEMIRGELAGSSSPIVEIGSGQGNIKQWIPECVTTDVFANEWLDRQENIYALRFEDRSVGAFILFDVWHHLRHPGAALRELGRALRPGGLVILFEPDMSALGRWIYGNFHHEPLELAAPIEWDAPPEFEANKPDYYAAQGNAWRQFVREETPAPDAWKVRRVRRVAALAYLATGGFRGPQLLPGFLRPVLRPVEALAGCCPDWFSTRLLVTLEKNAA